MVYYKEGWNGRAPVFSPWSIFWYFLTPMSKTINILNLKYIILNQRQGIVNVFVYVHSLTQGHVLASQRNDGQKTPAYGGHWISWRVRIVSMIQQIYNNNNCHVSPVTCNLSPVTWDQTTQGPPNNLSYPTKHNG